MTAAESAKTCESVAWSSGASCAATAIWLVSVGERKADAQRSCARHLSPTVTAMAHGEGEGRRPVIHVRSLP
jgi:hypothetical protein